jgi:hypothetical protein
LHRNKTTFIFADIVAASGFLSMDKLRQQQKMNFIKGQFLKIIIVTVGTEFHENLCLHYFN